MLVLMRRAGEALTINTGQGEVIVRILKVNGGQVQVGIDAPRSMAVLRDNAAAKSPKHSQEAWHGKGS